MIADESHYKSQWESFHSINPKANELFFVELQINEFDKLIKRGLKEIDFTNDTTNTPEGYENNMKCKDFFLHKDYKEFLEAKLIELKSEKDLKHLPKLENSIIVHYGCSDFNSNEHKVYWIGAISHKPNKAYFFESRNEVDAIEKFEKYIQGNKDKAFIHWSMNSPKFGFKAIENRYFDLTNIALKPKKEIDLMPKKEIDLSEFLKNKYGINYIDRENGRLNNLAKLNKFSGIQSEVEVININDATNRLELLYSIVQAEIQGSLKVLQAQQTQNNKTQIWFYVGIKLLTGELYKLSSEGLSYKQIAEKINNGKFKSDSLRPYISETIANTTKSDKNILSRKDFNSLVDYCNENNIEIKTEIHKNNTI